jgi:glycosyltransferase involved in cell wall biosynthesis
MPNAVLDALAAGIPVVATAVGGTLEIIQHGQNGWLVSPHDRTELVSSVHTILNSPDLAARLVQAGYESLSGFSRARMLRQIAMLIDSVRSC